jgi:rhodanese-related sulfurtransferase
MTKPAFRFLITLANIRLGVWLPNPRWAVDVPNSRGDRRLKARGPRPSYLFRELLGLNRIDDPYLYVSDGGHYENLGLVELLRRGCTRVFCLDASGGQTFSELGDAVALARSELGVEVEIDPTPLMPVAEQEGDPPMAKQDTVAGTLRFPDGTTGVIVYARNVVSPGEPWDVLAHQREDPRFPHDSTLDQLYTDQKFESYRRLGAEAGEHAVALMAREYPPTARHHVRAAAVLAMLEDGAVQLVDVRGHAEREAARVPAALHIPVAELHSRRDELAADRPVVFLCGDGDESLIAARAFRAAGWDAFQVEGGLRRWHEAGGPLER